MMTAEAKESKNRHRLTKDKKSLLYQNLKNLWIRIQESLSTSCGT